MLRVLNIEDNVFKHRDICNVIEGCGRMEIEWAKNLEAGIELIQSSNDNSTPYDLIVTDMYYPLVPGGDEEEAGEVLIQKVKEMGLDVPIILCSSVNYRIPEILGTVYYSDRTDWENDLRALVKRIM